MRLVLALIIAVGMAAAAGLASAVDIEVLFSFSPEEGRTVSGYEMYSDQNRICEPLAAEIVPDGANWTFTCGPAPTGWHGFSMRAVYENGQKSPFSASFPFYVQAAGPVVIHVKVTNSDGQETIFIPER